MIITCEIVNRRISQTGDCLHTITRRNALTHTQAEAYVYRIVRDGHKTAYISAAVSTVPTAGAQEAEEEEEEAKYVCSRTNKW